MTAEDIAKKLATIYGRMAYYCPCCTFVGNSASEYVKHLTEEHSSLLQTLEDLPSRDSASLMKFNYDMFKG